MSTFGSRCVVCGGGGVCMMNVSGLTGWMRADGPGIGVVNVVIRVWGPRVGGSRIGAVVPTSGIM